MKTHEARIIIRIDYDDDGLPVFVYGGYRLQVPNDEPDVVSYMLDLVDTGGLETMPNFRIWGPQNNSRPKSALAPATPGSDGIMRTYDLVKRSLQVEVDAFVPPEEM